MLLIFLGEFQWDVGTDHWKAIKKLMTYLQCTKGFMLIYSNSDDLKILGYTNSDFEVAHMAWNVR